MYGIKILTNRERVNFPTHRAMTKNVTKLAWWWGGSILINTTNQGDRAGCIVAVGVDLDCVASEVLYLRWFLCGEWISDGPAETVMVGEG